MVDATVAADKLFAQYGSAVRTVALELCPLHFAVYNKAGADAIVALLQAHPNAAQVPDKVFIAAAQSVGQSFHSIAECWRINLLPKRAVCAPRFCVRTAQGLARNLQIMILRPRACLNIYA